MAPIAVGATVPDAVLSTALVDFGADVCARPTPLSTASLFDGKKVVVVGVPGAFTPTCSESHVPGFITHKSAILSKGVNTIAVISVNDAFVMAAWQKSFGKESEGIVFVGDGSADFTKKTGLEFDLTAKGLGLRCKRFAMVIDNKVVKYLGFEDATGLAGSGAEAVLASL